MKTLFSPVTGRGMRWMVSAFLTTVILASAGAATAGENKVTVIGRGAKPAIAAGARGSLYAVFESPASVSAARGISFAQSNDGGRTWSAARDICPHASAASKPCIAVESDGAIDVAWSDEASGGNESNSDIYFARSGDSGNSWTAPIDLARTQRRSTNPELAVGPANAIHVVWIDETPDQSKPDVFYSWSKDGGKSFNPPQDISNTPGICSTPSVVVADSGAVHVAWLDTTSGKDHPDVFYRMSAHGAFAPANKTNTRNVSNSAKISSHPVLALGRADRLYIAWTDNSLRADSADVWCVVVGRQGKMTTPINVSFTTGVSANPAICADKNGHVAIAWSDSSYGRPDIFGRVSRDNLDDISYALDLSGTSGTSLCRDPSVTLTGGDAYVIWEQEKGADTLINCTSLVLKDIGTGPSFDVNLKSANGRRVEF
jgi:hypothetical protein